MNTKSDTKPSTKLYDIHCPSCGAPAYYEIKKRTYTCGYCGNNVGLERAISDHKGFREIRKKNLRKTLKNFELQKGTCSGCGAEVVFEEGEALAGCPFCGRSMVRKAFANPDVIPELAIPFSITKEEAKEILADWCKKNSLKKEARAIREKVGELKGCYLPYELVRGPVDCTVFRIENGRSYECGGFIDQEFVNCSKKLDNLLLDGMEPYNLDELAEFDFGFVAGHQVKVGDISSDELERRIKNEVSENYRPVIQKTMEAKAVGVVTDVKNVVRMPVLLPVYYLAFDGYMAAVNGQTGKVSVRAIRESHYIILPWWLKAILWTIIGTGLVVLGMFLLGAQRDLLLIGGCCLGVLLLIVLLCAYSENMENKFMVEAGRKIFTSKGGPWIRQDRGLVQSKKPMKRPITKPIFFMDLEGHRRPVELKFTSALRVVRTLALAAVVMFLPVVLALFINGFNFKMIELGGSAAWFCLSVPLVPIFLVKYGRIDIYDNPWIYIIEESGQKRRYKKKIKLDFDKKEVTKTILTGLFKPPVCFLVWFCILCFGAMVYLTAFGFQ